MEALVLFNEVYLDGPSVTLNQERLQWLFEIDAGIHKIEIDDATAEALYRRGATLAKSIEPSRANGTLFLNDLLASAAAEITSDLFYSGSIGWDDLPSDLPPILYEVKHTLDDAFGSHHPFSAAAFVAIARLLYYLALQEHLGSPMLLLDATKGYSTVPPSLGFSRQVLEIFENEIQLAFAQREQRWLGSTERSIEVPLIGAHVLETASRKGWSIGRVIAWMRTWNEVAMFRSGMQRLVESVEDNDRHAMDAIFEDLDAGLQAWTRRLGSRVPTRRINVTVAIPFLQPNLAIPHPWESRRPGRKMLVLVNRLLG